MLADNCNNRTLKVLLGVYDKTEKFYLREA